MTTVNAYLKKLHEIDSNDAYFRSVIEDCTIREYRVLAMAKEKTLRLGQLSAKRSVTVQGIGRMCSSLADRGLIKIERDSRDRRAKNVYLTVDGEELERRCRHTLERVLKSRSD